MPGSRNPAANTSEATETKASFARRLGVSRQAVGKYCLDAAFPIDNAGNVRIKAALAWAASNLGRAAAGDADDRPEAAEPPGLVEHKIKLLVVQIERGQIALARERGELIAYEDARRALATFMRMHRDVALQFAVRHGPAIAAEVGCDEGELIAAISSYMRTALDEAADNPRPFQREPTT